MTLISDFLMAEVVDVDGEKVGFVDDVRLVQDGPVLAGFGAALRMEGLVIGSGGLAVRLGYHRHGVKGPVLLKRLFMALERRARFAPWDEVDRWDGERVTLRCPVAALPHLTDVE